MLPVLNIGPLALQTSGLVLLLSTWVALNVIERAAPRYQTPPNQLYNLALLAILAGMVGGRLSYIAQYPGSFLASPLSALSLNPGLIDPAGGIIIALLSGAIYIQRKSLDWGRTLDSLAPGLAVLLVGISLSHLASGNHYGTPTSLPWGVELWGQTRHPTQLYELFASLAILALTWPKFEIVPGEIAGLRFWTFSAFSAGASLFLSAFQADAALLAGSLRSAQIIAWLALALSLQVLNRLMRRAM